MLSFFRCLGFVTDYLPSPHGWTVHVSCAVPGTARYEKFSGWFFSTAAHPCAERRIHCAASRIQNTVMLISSFVCLCLCVTRNQSLRRRDFTGDHCQYFMIDRFRIKSSGDLFIIRNEI